jgi:carbon-monoxide dehydrogenase large subunit
VVVNPSDGDPGPVVGTAVPRVEDSRLLTGRGRFVDDIQLPGMLHAAFVRSHDAHGLVRSVDTGAARAAPGVRLVLTAADLDGVVGELRPHGPPALATPAYGALAQDKVRVVGEPIAIVVADTRALAEDACELVDVRIDALPAVTTIAGALDPSAPLLFEEVGSNVMFRRAGRYGDPEDAFARADVVVTEHFEQQRMANVPLEGRACVADFDSDRGVLAVDVAHQNPHALRVALATLLGIDTEHVVVRCGDIGGSFGQKAYTSREELAVCAAARMVGRPVKWVEDRTENLLAAGHARDDELDVALALTLDGTILGARVRMTVNQGAYQPTTVPPSIYLDLVRVLFPNAYRIEHFEFEGTVVASNTGTYIAFRGPWESESWTRERMIDIAARALGMEPADLRRRNLLTGDEQPTRMVTGPTVSHMTAREAFDRAHDLAALHEFRREQRAARERGECLGFGMSVFAEAAPGPPDYSAALGAGASSRSAQQARARLEADGTITVFTSQQPHGQGHETTLAQLAADVFGLPLASTRVVHGDTVTTPFNAVGTGGSRAATLASGAVIGAVTALRGHIVDVFADAHELDPSDVEVYAGRVMARGVPASAWDLAAVAAAAPEPLDAVADFAIPDGGWTVAAHCCWVEVDLVTGLVRIPRYMVVEDCGQIINPAIVDGQIAGGVAQGLSTVLLERVVYDGNGQLTTASLLDYLLPTAYEVPSIEIEHLASPPQGPIDFRGVGETGAIGAPAALTNAIEDALASFFAPAAVRITHKHCAPERILAVVHQQTTIRQHSRDDHRVNSG